ncbi:MAG: acyltransferase family protein [Hyphomicrobiales bacterium]
MFGGLRFVLSIGVVISHLWAGLSHWSAVYAVFGFFVLSGYLMTLVLHRSYGFTPAGQLRYLSNRALRIFPVYLVVLALSLAAVPVIGPSENPIRVFLPQVPVEWLQNIFIFGLDSGAIKIIPPAWTLYTEFVFYIAMGLGLSLNRWTVAVWLAVSLAYTVWLAAGAESFAPLYYAILPASLPFALGAGIYLLLGAQDWRLPAWVVRTVVAVFVLHLFGADKVWGKEGIFFGGFYLSLLLSAAAVAVLAGRAPQGRAERIDRFLGDISYPVFLVHWVVAGLAVALFGMKSGGGLFFACLPVIMLVSAALHRFAEIPVNRYRDAIRAARRPAAAVPAPVSQP